MNTNLLSRYSYLINVFFFLCLLLNQTNQCYDKEIIISTKPDDGTFIL